MVTSIKREKIASAIKKTLGEIFIREQLANITITDVKVSSRLETARIYYSIFNSQAITDRSIIQKYLSQKQPYFRHLIAEQLNLRLTPLLIFQYDETEERASRIHSLISEII